MSQNINSFENDQSVIAKTIKNSLPLVHEVRSSGTEIKILFDNRINLPVIEDAFRNFFPALKPTYENTVVKGDEGHNHNEELAKSQQVVSLEKNFLTVSIPLEAHKDVDITSAIQNGAERYVSLLTTELVTSQLFIDGLSNRFQKPDASSIKQKEGIVGDLKFPDKGLQQS